MARKKTKAYPESFRKDAVRLANLPDRGVQYRSNHYQNLVQDYGFRSNMSRKGSCWDNAVIESFFSRLKVELIYAENYAAVDEARSGIFEYIELFYNQTRWHSANGYIGPNQFNVSTFRG